MHSSTPRGTPSRRGRPARSDSAGPSQPAGPSTLQSNNSPTTLISSLNIPVEGALRIEPEISAGGPLSRTTDTHKLFSTAQSKRAPRKSKTEALAALQSHAQSSSNSSDDMGPTDSGPCFSGDPKPIPVSPVLILDSVRTSSPRQPQDLQQPRPFGLEECPVFYPTKEEFQDPMAYVRSIRQSAKNYGICKVRPPDDWKMPFVTDTTSFRFKTRLQRLNSIEASSRAKINFLEQLYRWHKQQGNCRVAVPTINHKPLDLWLLRKEVDNLGGYEAVNRDKKWSDLGRILGYSGIPGLSSQLKNSYARVILPYEDFCEQVRNTSSMSPSSRAPQQTCNLDAPLVGRRLDSSASSVDDSSPPSSPLTTTSSLSDNGEFRAFNGHNGHGSRPLTESDSRGNGIPTPRKSIADSSLSSPIIPPPVFHDRNEHRTSSEQICEICHKKNHGEKMLLCDGCDCGFHTYCLVPELLTIPKGQWFCHTCLVATGGDYGFDEGEEHSLSSFQARDLAFRRMWFQSHPPPLHDQADYSDNSLVNRFGDVYVSESDVEQEFWRLVQSPHEIVEVEYGADVHSTTHGSAMPTLETHPLDPYSKDPWNLNNIPIVPDSLLRYIKSDISGMTVPWTYVGMLFSTFCWHNEDHYTYSMNYMHWGETKTWYGIPGADAEIFEAAIKSEAPDLFDAQPDLLFQLVTLMNPKRVRDTGVRVYACNQRAGEFVITFPKAYHAGFNHGLNFNEAVNFALPDWLPFGRDCVQRYKEHRKLPVFSHDELLITITQQAQSIPTAIWLLDSLKEMTEREMNNRKTARSLGMAEILEEEDRHSEEHYQCTICKVFCYLSQVVCACCTKVVCVEHADLLCNHAAAQLTLRKRFSDEDLLSTQSKVAERAAVPRTWRGKLEKILQESARPPLRALRALLAEGERINFPLPELQALRKCVNRANEWIEAANAFLIRKPSRKRSRRTRTKLSGSELLMSNGAEDCAERAEHGLDVLFALLGEVKSLGFDCPEINTLEAHAVQAEDTRKKACDILAATIEERNRDEFIQECERLLLHGSSLNVHLEELVEVERIVLREQLIRELEEKLEDSSLTLEEVRQLLSRARACDLASDNALVKALETRQRSGQHWEERVNNLLSTPYKTIDDLCDLTNVDPTIPVDPALLDCITSTLAKARDFEKQAKAWLKPEGGQPRVQEVLKLVSRAEKDFSVVAVQELKRTAVIAADLEKRCEDVLKNTFLFGEDDGIFDTMDKWRVYAREHLNMFSLPTFEKFDQQLTQHYRWLKDVPWWCPDHQKLHGEIILEDVLDCTRPDEELPPTDEYFTCICTVAVRPPSPGKISDAVQCDHCFARFHGICAANGGSCPFCDHHHWNGTLHKDRNWHYCYLPPMLHSAPDVTKNYSEDWKQLQIIVHRLDRLSTVIGQFLSFASQPANQRAELIPQVRHYMRKLYKIQFAVSPNPELSFGLDLASLHRILAGQPTPVRAKKRRRPKFVFDLDTDKDSLDNTRCVCRGRGCYVSNYATVECDHCGKLYHAACVHFPLDQPPANKFTCPLCCLRKTRLYPYADIRVRHSDHADPDVYVNIKEMMDTFSRDILYKKSLPSYGPTIYIDLVRFIPGQPDQMATNGSASRSNTNIMHHSPMASPPHLGSHHNGSTPISAPPPGPVAMISSYGNVVAPANQVAHHVVPPPPWSRWGTVTTPLRPPATMRRNQSDSSRGTTPNSWRKRKQTEEIQPLDDASTHARSPKRRAFPATSATSPSIAPPRPARISTPPVIIQPKRSPGPSTPPSMMPSQSASTSPVISPPRPPVHKSPSLAYLLDSDAPTLAPRSSNSGNNDSPRSHPQILPGR